MNRSSRFCPIEIRRRRWLISAQGSSLREPWVRIPIDVITLKGFGGWRTLSRVCQENRNSQKTGNDKIIRGSLKTRYKSNERKKFFDHQPEGIFPTDSERAK